MSCDRAPAAGLTVTVKPLVGAPVTGELLAVSTDGVVVLTDDGEFSCDADSLPSVEFRPAATSVAESSDLGQVWLRSGSTLPISQVTSDAGAKSLRCQLPEFIDIKPKTTSVAIDRVSSLRLPGASTEFDKPWRELQQRKATGDLIVTPPRGEGALDYLEGYVGGIDEDSIELTLDGETIQAPRQRVYGLVFASNAKPLPDFLGVQVIGPGGMRLNATQLSLAGPGRIAVSLSDGTEFSLPLSRLQAIDYRKGRVVPLDGIEVVRSRLTSVFGNRKSDEEVVAWPAYRNNRSYWGKPLRLFDPDEPVRKHRQFEHGVAVRTGADIAYALSGSFRQFQAVVGLDPDAVGAREAIVELAVDGEPRWAKTLRSGEGPVVVDLPIAGGRELRLRIERSEGLDVSVHFGDARLVR